MIIYLGMPKCASTWIWNSIKHNFDYDGTKEPHTLVEWGTKHNDIIDFSTNNWSMDSTTVQLVDKDISKYILIIRDPIELAISYYVQTGVNGETFDEFVDALIKTKLLCFGDIIERWYKLVDKNKILVYNYNTDIQNNQETFMQNFCRKLNITCDKSIPMTQKIFQTTNKPKLTCNVQLMEQLRYQMNKFKNIIG
tara:strand:+ start:1329 stop:1913 length:585 start_codon:yes stop_codon:yes gene_type:complete